MHFHTILLLLLLSVPISALGQTPAPHLSTLPDLVEPREVMIGDFDGDGNPDVAVVSGTKTSWFENQFDQSNGLVSRGTVTRNVGSGHSGVAADFDRDGSVDMLSFGAFSVPVVSLNNGYGNFNTEVQLPHASSDNLLSPHAADIDGDGDPDIVAYRYDPDEVVWFENTLDENAEFAGAVSLSGPIEGQSSLYKNYLEVLDLTDDGFPDLVYTSGDSLIWQENLRPSQSAMGPKQLISERADGFFALHAADVTGDGHSDLIVNGRSALLLAVNQMETNGSFAAPIAISSETSNHFITADVNADGAPDVVIGSGNSGVQDAVVWIENQWEHTSEFGGVQTLSDEQRFVRALGSLDLDGDGLDDVVTAGSGGAFKVGYLRNNSSLPNALEDLVVFNTPASMPHPHAVATGDIDGDGDLDVAAADPVADKIVWYENRLDAQGDHGPEQGIVSDFNAYDLVLTDLDGGADLDAVFAAGKLYWVENTTTGSVVSFGTPEMITDASAQGVLAADLDADGDPDIVGYGGERFVVENALDASGSFGVRVDLTPDDATATALANVDGDTFPDVVGVQNPFSGTPTLVTYVNQSQDGALAFASEQHVATLDDDPYDLEAVDLNGDGAVDVVTSSSRALTFFRTPGTSREGLDRPRICRRLLVTGTSSL